MNINAATFQYFQLPHGSELLARVFLIQPSEVELKTRTRGGSKRRPNLSYEELEARADEAGVKELYVHAVATFEPLLQKSTTRSSVRFAGSIDGSRKVVISFLPGESNADDGLRYQLYKNRYAQLAKLPPNEVETLIPLRHEDWSFGETLNTDYHGFKGFITNRQEIDRLAEALTQGPVPKLTTHEGEDDAEAI